MIYNTASKSRLTSYNVAKHVQMVRFGLCNTFCRVHKSEVHTEICRDSLSPEWVMAEEVCVPIEARQHRVAVEVWHHGFHGNELMGSVNIPLTRLHAACTQAMQPPMRHHGTSKGMSDKNGRGGDEGRYSEVVLGDSVAGALFPLCRKLSASECAEQKERTHHKSTCLVQDQETGQTGKERQRYAADKDKDRTSPSRTTAGCISPGSTLTNTKTSAARSRQGDYNQDGRDRAAQDGRDRAAQVEVEEPYAYVPVGWVPLQGFQKKKGTSKGVVQFDGDGRPAGFKKEASMLRLRVRYCLLLQVILHPGASLNTMASVHINQHSKCTIMVPLTWRAFRSRIDMESLQVKDIIEEHEELRQHLIRSLWQDTHTHVSLSLIQLTHAACVASSSFASQAAMTPTSLDALAALLSLKSSPFSFALQHCAASLAVLFAQEETLKSVQYCRTVLYRLFCILVQAYTGLTFGNDFLLSADFEIRRSAVDWRCF